MKKATRPRRPAPGFTVMVVPQRGHGQVRQLTLTRRDMERYAAAFDQYLHDLGQSCLRRRVDYVTWRTDLAFEKLFLELLSRGSALSQG